MPSARIVFRIRIQHQSCPQNPNLMNEKIVELAKTADPEIQVRSHPTTPIFCFPSTPTTHDTHTERMPRFACLGLS